MTGREITFAFQFHTGSIRRFATRCSNHAVNHVFQFHTGSIRREVAETFAAVRSDRFNSTLVRLEDSFPPHVCQLP